MSDAESATTAPGAPDSLPSEIIDDLTALNRKWAEIEDTRDIVDTPPTLTTEQLEAGREIMAEIATELLPSIQQHLDKLTKALGLGPFARDPTPQLRDLQEVIANLGQLLDRTNDTIVSLSPWVYNDESAPVPIADQDYGVLKRIRCDSLFDLFRAILRQSMHDFIDACIVHIDYFRSGKLARHQAAITAYNDYDYRESRPPTPQPHPAGERIVELVGSCRQELSRLIEICTQSDLALLQQDWRWLTQACDIWLSELAERLRVIPEPPAEEGQPIGRPERNAFDQQHEPANAIGPPDHEYPPGIFIHRLLNKPRATTFQISDDLPTADLVRLGTSVRHAGKTVDLILTQLCWMYDDDMFTDAGHRLLDKWPRDLTIQLDRVIVLLNVYHSPPPVPSALAPSESIFKTMFYSLRGQLFLATRNFIAEAVRFNSLRNVANQDEDPEGLEDLELLEDM
ncbi:hypothetical protein PCANC_23411 [Puccinia coronata f. sp. avenae]|uniref:Uncharacterized protein n=1 Tax=Puccinia coronata f. sp. avenae TaxID=200324 RepID=A0A2N5TVW6_9BASI|nr:hypothetical protein PCANC_23411 [Puccinia coronata f. sp. avenae]